jgi:hypothetical protein
MRKISQTATVEDYNPNAAANLSAPTTDKLRPASSSALVDEDAETSQPKKKHWFNVRKTRRHSDGGAVARDDEPIATAPTPGKSFVVIRDKKPQRPQSSSVLQQIASVEATGSGGSEDVTPKERRGSFVVLRDNKNGSGKGSS